MKAKKMETKENIDLEKLLSKLNSSKKYFSETIKNLITGIQGENNKAISNMVAVDGADTDDLLKSSGNDTFMLEETQGYLFLIEETVKRYIEGIEDQIKNLIRVDKLEEKLGSVNWEFQDAVEQGELLETVVESFEKYKNFVSIVKPIEIMILKGYNGNSVFSNEEAFKRIKKTLLKFIDNKKFAE